MPQNFIATVAIEILLNFFCVFLSPILMAGKSRGPSPRPHPPTHVALLMSANGKFN